MAKPLTNNLVVMIMVLLIGPSPVLTDVLPAYALVNCRIVPDAGLLLEKGIIIIRHSPIESIVIIGTIKIPEDAEVIEAEGLTACPGLVSAHTKVYIEEPEEKQPTLPAPI